MIAVLAAVVIALLALVIDLPGPRLGEVLGSDGDEDPLNLDPCKPSPDNVQFPGGRPTPERWERAGRLPVARDELRAASVGRRIFVVGGQARRPDGRLRSASSLFILDSRTGTVTRGPDMPLPLDHAAVASDGRNVWAAGGISNFRARGEVLRYSPRQRRWSTETHLRQPRGSGGANFIDDRLYVVGGAPPTLPEPNRTPYGTLEIFDTRTRRWTPGPDLPTARHHLATAVLDGKLYVLGGRAPGDFSIAAFERYDPETEQWTELPPLPEGAGGLAAASVGGQIVAIGGGDDAENWVTPATWAFDPEDGRWRRMRDLTIARHGHAAAAAGARVYAIGGAPCPGFGHTASVESLAVR
jgi:hypothetical protein